MTVTTTTTNKKFRMAAFDLDGTLLNSNHDLSPATITYLRHLHSKGFIIAIATGRSAACAAHIIEKLDLDSNDENNNATDDINDGNTNDGRNNAAPSLGFPLVCTNGARGLRIRKSQSDVDVGHNTNNLVTPSSSRRCTRSNTDPLPHTEEKNANPTNPFLKRTLEISHEIFHNPLSPSLTLKTLALAHTLNCVTNYYHDHRIYAVVRNENQLELTKRYGTLTGSEELYCYLNDLNLNSNDEEGKGEKEEDCDASKSTTTTTTTTTRMPYYDERNAYGYQKAVELGPPSKLLILCDTSKLDEITNLVRTELNGTTTTKTITSDEDVQQQQKQKQAHVIRGAPPFFVEILHPTVHKGEGLRRLCQSLSIPLEEVIAFGDGDNDLEFVQMAGWGVAMKNARGVLKEVADEVTEGSNDQDGVVKTLEWYEQEGKLHFPKEEK